MGRRCSILIMFGAACLVGCSEETDTPAEVAARGGGAAESTPAASTQKPAPVENATPSDAPPPVSKTLLRPVVESERVEVTRPDSTPPQAIPPVRTIEGEPKESKTPVADDGPQQEDERVATSEENGRERRRTRRRNRSRRSIVLSSPVTQGSGGFIQSPSGGSADFGTESVPLTDFGSFSPDAFSDGSEYDGGTPLSGSGDYGGPGNPDGGFSGGYDGYAEGYGGYSGEYGPNGVNGDDLAQTADGYNPRADGGPSGGHDGLPTGSPNGGLTPTPPAPPPDF